MPALMTAPHTNAPWTWSLPVTPLGAGPQLLPCLIRPARSRLSSGQGSDPIPLLTAAPRPDTEAQPELALRFRRQETSEAHPLAPALPAPVTNPV